MDSQLSLIFINGLAVFAMGWMLRYVDGPFDVFLKFRELCGISTEPVIDHDMKVGEVEIIADTFLAKLVSCFWCSATWLSIICVTIWYIAPIIVIILAVIGVSGILNEVVNGKVH